MPEVANAGENHCEAKTIGGVNNFLILH